MKLSKCYLHLDFVNFVDNAIIMVNFTMNGTIGTAQFINYSNLSIIK